MKSPIEVWLSLVERYVRDVEAVCSNHITSTKKKPHETAARWLFCVAFLFFRIQPFFVTWGVLRKTGFFQKWQVNTGKWQVKWQVENGQFVPVVGILGTGSVVQ